MTATHAEGRPHTNEEKILLQVGEQRGTGTFGASPLDANRRFKDLSGK